MVTVTVQKNVVDMEGGETLYAFAATAETEEQAVLYACLYASMVEYGLTAQKWQPSDLPFPKEQLYQFIQPATLYQLEAIYPDTITTAYANANAYIQSYIGAMFDVNAILDSGETTTTANTLRLALCLSTAIFILSSTPQYSDVVKQLNDQLSLLLRGLKSGQRNFGKSAIVGEPNVRVAVVSLSKEKNRP